MQIEIATLPDDLRPILATAIARVDGLKLDQEGVNGKINCCSGLVKLHPERIAGYCVYN